jgi:hypothetical protein
MSTATSVTSRRDYYPRCSLILLGAVLMLGCWLVMMMSLAPMASAASEPISWSEPNLIDPEGSYHAGISGLACPSTGLCVAVDAAGNILSTTKPDAAIGPWDIAKVEHHELTGISCPSEQLCVATDAFGDVLTATKPTAGASAWTVTNVDENNDLRDISCSSVELCIATDEVGNAVVSTDPTGGTSSWTVVNIGGNQDLSRVFCVPLTSLCVVIANPGRFLTSTNPTGGVGAWTSGSVADAGYMYGLSCASTELCVATNGEGNVITSSNPGGGASTWSVTHLGRDTSLSGISCPSNQLCVGGSFVVSTEPLGGPDAWFSSSLEGKNAITNVSCPSVAYCVATDDAGNVRIGTLTGASTVRTGGVPINTKPPAITGNLVEGQTLTVLPGEWVNTPTERHYQWLTCSPENSSAGGCTEIPGATSTTYQLTAADVGLTIAVVETVSNACGEGKPTWPVFTSDIQPASESEPVASEEKTGEHPSGSSETKGAPIEGGQTTGGGSMLNIGGTPTGNVGQRPGIKILPDLVACSVPRLEGKTLIQAKKLLKHDHCQLGKVTRRNSHLKHPVVLSQKPGTKKILPAGAKISVELT